MLTVGITKAIQPLSDRVDALQKSETDGASGGQNESAQKNNQSGIDMNEIEKILTTALQKQLEPLEERIGTIEKARGTSRQQEPAAELVVKSEKNYMSYFE